jgi:hypothetical protein
VDKEMAYEFKTLTLEQMVDYIEKNAPQDKRWFKEVAFEMRGKKEAVPQFDKDGNPIMKADKNGKAKQVVKMVEVEGSEKKPVFNLLKAKYAFCERYMKEIIPVAKNKKSLANDILANW